MTKELSTPQQKAEYNSWVEAVYPYDLAECGCCVTQHAIIDCKFPAHSEMREEAKRLGFNVETQRRIGPRIRKKILSFREKFAQFYGGSKP